MADADRRTPGSTAINVDPSAYFTRRDPRIVAVAHRGGAHLGIPDNSLAALERAAELGFRYVEIDLRATTDGRLVLWHGVGLERLRPWRRLDLNEARQGGRIDHAHDPVDLQTAIRSLPDDMCFFLDLKNSDAAGLVGQVVQETGVGRRICVGSFSGARTQAAARAVEEATGSRPARTLTPSELISLGLGAYLGFRSAPPEGVSAQIPAWSATRYMIRSAHERNVVVIAWTVNRRADMHRLLDRGADGLMTDDLPLLKGVLTERGAWTW